MNSPIKQQLHQLIDNCENAILLSEAKEFLQSSTAKDWWEELSENDKTLLFKSEKEYEDGKFVTNEAFMKKYNEWKKKKFERILQKMMSSTLYPILKITGHQKFLKN